jgi:bacterioferritin-associated ferredoxin
MVDRCICHEVTFAHLQRLHRAEGLSLEQLSERTGCCTGCTMCEPYVRLMLKTGATDFPVLDPRQTAAIMRDR